MSLEFEGDTFGDRRDMLHTRFHEGICSFYVLVWGVRALQTGYFALGVLTTIFTDSRGNAYETKTRLSLGN